jgi:hypothetical protein
MRRTILLALVCGCAPTATPSSSPTTSTVENAGSTSPREVEFAYRSGDDPQPAERETVPTSVEPATSEDPVPAPEPTEIAAIAERTVLDAMTEHPSVLLTPALPVEWPPKRGEVAYIAYPIEPLASGVTKWRVERPIARVVVKLADKSAIVEKLAAKSKKPLGTFENLRASATDPIHTAEATLFAIVEGRGDADKQRHRLQPYVDWLDAHAVVRADVRERVPAFVAWLSAKP